MPVKVINETIWITASSGNGRTITYPQMQQRRIWESEPIDNSKLANWPTDPLGQKIVIGALFFLTICLFVDIWNGR